VAGQLQSFPKAQAPISAHKVRVIQCSGFYSKKKSVQGMFKYLGMQLPTPFKSKAFFFLKIKSKAFSFFGHFLEVQVRRLQFLLLLLMLAITVQSLAS